MATVQDYLKKHATASQKTEFERIRKIIYKIVPDAEEMISYGIPTFKYKNKYLLYFGAFKDHMSIYPGARIESMKDKLKGFKLGKGTIQYTENNLIPESIIKDLLINRVAEVDAKG